MADKVIKQKLRWIVILFIALLLTTAAFLITRYYQDKIINQATESQADQSDWKTYQNQLYGFSFRYPSNFGKLKAGELDCPSVSDVEKNALWDGGVDCESGLRINFENSDSSLLILKFPTVNSIYPFYYEGAEIYSVNIAKNKDYIDQASEGIQLGPIDDLGPSDKLNIQKINNFKTEHYYSYLGIFQFLTSKYRFFNGSTMFEFSVGSDISGVSKSSVDRVLKNFDISGLDIKTLEAFQDIDQVMKTFNFLS